MNTGTLTFLTSDTATFMAVHNTVRLQNGLAPLMIDPLLSATAKAKAEDMATFGQLQHWSPRLGYPGDQIRAQDGGDRFFVIGENIGDFPGGTNPVIMLELFLNSPAHAENILNPTFNTMGAAIVQNDVTGRRWAAIHFGASI